MIILASTESKTCEFFDFLVVASLSGTVYLGPAPNPGIFLGISSENHLGLRDDCGLMTAHGETKQGSVGTQPCQG